MRVAFIGYGEVGSIHARRMRGTGDVTLAAVCGPNAAKAEAFARRHGVGRATTDIAEALDEADAAIVCSPSPVHFEQALRAVERGVATLVELPACSSLAEALRLEEGAGKTLLQCAHTSRYLATYRTIGGWLAEGRLGAIRHVRYARSVRPRRTSWADDALLHHAEHPLDLCLHWFGELKPLACAAGPGIPGAQDVVLLAELASRAPVAISISYTDTFPGVTFTIVGADHTVVTDGFSYIRCDDFALAWQGDGQETYERGIEDQDRAFFAACRTGCAEVPWRDTIRLNRYVEDFANLWKRE